MDEPEQKTDTISVPIPQCEESENIPLSDFPEQPVWNLKGHGMFSGARSNHNRFPIFSQKIHHYQICRNSLKMYNDRAVRLLRKEC